MAGILSVQVDFDQVAIGDHEHALSDLVDTRSEPFFVAGEATNDELSTVAPRFLHRMRQGLAQTLPTGSGLCLVEALYGHFTAQRRQQSVQDHGYPEASSVYHACLLEDTEQLRRPFDRGMRF